MDLWSYGVAFKGSSELANSAKVLRQLTRPGKRCEQRGERGERGERRRRRMCGKEKEGKKQEEEVD